MLRFDLPSLLRDLSRMRHPEMVAFSLACAERTVALAGRTVPAAVIRALNLAHLFLNAAQLDQSLAKSLSVEVEALSDIDDDHVAATAFVLECLTDKSVEAASCAATRAYDRADALAQSSLNFSVYTSAVEAQLLGHPAVQLELTHQLSDIRDLLHNVRTPQEIAARANTRTVEGPV